jgi:hypothetical protein
MHGFCQGVIGWVIDDVHTSLIEEYAQKLFEAYVKE